MDSTKQVHKGAVVGSAYLFDLAIRNDHSTIAGTILVLCTTFVGALMGGLFAQDVQWVLTGLVAGFIFGAPFLFLIVASVNRHRTECRTRFELQIRQAHGRLESVLNEESGAHDDLGVLAQKPGEFVEILIQAGCTSSILLMYLPRKKAEPVILPFKLPFEPARLDDSDSNFRSLSSDIEKPGEAHRPAETPELLGAVRRATRMKQIGVWSLVPLIILLLNWKNLNACFVAPILLGYAGVIASIISFWLSPSSSFWVVPGGILSPSESRYYRRESSVLVWFPSNHTLWAADNAQGASARQVTPKEAELAMRAWSSPLPPPSEEMVRSFMEG